MFAVDGPELQADNETTSKNEINNVTIENVLFIRVLLLGSLAKFLVVKKLDLSVYQKIALLSRFGRDFG